MEAAAGSGFMTITGLDGHVPVGSAVRADLLRLFGLSDAEKRKLLRRTFDPSRPNVYRGLFPAAEGWGDLQGGDRHGSGRAAPCSVVAG